MKLPHQLLLKLSPLVELARGEPLVEPFVEVADSSEAQLVLHSSHGRFLFDKVKGQVLKDGQDLCAFSEVQSVDIGAFPGGRGERSWSIVLFCGFVRRITLARTYDDGEASVLAAQLAQVLGCKVLSLSARK